MPNNKLHTFRIIRDTECTQGHQRGSRGDTARGEGKAATERTEVTNQSRTRLYLIRLVSDDAVHVHVDVLVDDKDVHVDWAIVGRDVDPGGHGGHGFRRV